MVSPRIRATSARLALFRPLAAILISVGFLAPVRGGEPADLALASPAPQVLPIGPGFAGSSVNVVAGLQNTLFTDGDMQFAAFYAPDGVVVLARRRLADTAWETVRTRFTGNVADAHHTIAIAVDGAGFLHVAWSHHGNPLNYARGVAPRSLQLGEKRSMTGSHEDRVTYPQFVRMPAGDLLFFYRDGRSGQGNLVLNRYIVATEKWTQVHPNLIDGEGRRSAYPTVMADRDGVLHLAWNWRDTPDVATNHDLAYAQSSDGGATWKSIAGAPLAIPLTAENADYALRIPTNRSLMNPPAITADAEGRPCLADYWCPEGSDVPQYHVVRHDGKRWNVLQVTHRTTPFVLAGTATKRPPLSRSVLLSQKSEGGRTSLVLVYRDDEQRERIVAASCSDIAARKPVWSFCLLSEEPVGAWEPSLDPEQSLRMGHLSMLIQRVEQRDGDDRAAAAVPPTPVSVLTWAVR